MANKSFSMQLDDIPVPGNYGQAQGLIEQSGRTQGEAGKSAGAAKAMGTNIVTEAATTVFSTARDAVIGYEKAGVERKVEDAVAKYEDSPENVKNASASEAFKAGQEKGLALEHPLMVELKAKADKYEAAKKQGFITKDEALTRMAAAVKEASARLPGLASEFRKVAADKTGISAVDIYQVHESLTKESSREAAAKAAAAAQQKYINAVSEHFGIPPGMVTPKYMELYAADKALKNEVTQLEARSKMKNLSREERAIAFGGVVQNYVSQDLLKLSAGLTEWHKLNNDVSKGGAAKRDLLLSNMNDMIDNQLAMRLAQINQQQGKLGLSTDEITKQTNLLKTQYGAFKDMLKTKEGRDILATTLGRGEQGVKQMQVDFAQMFPVIKMMQDTKMFDTVFTNLQSPQGRAMLDRFMGPGFSAGISKQVQNIPQWAERQRQYFDPEAYREHGPVDLGATRNKPEAQKLDMQTTLGNLRMLANKPAAEWTDQDRQNGEFLVGTSGKTLESQLVRNPANAEYIIRNNEAAADRYLQTLTPQQKEEVGARWQYTGEKYAAEQYKEVERVINDLKNLDEMKTTSVKVVSVPGKGLTLEMTQAKGTTPSQVVTYENGLFAPGVKKDIKLAPVSHFEARQVVGMGSTVEDQAAQVRKVLNKLNLSLRTAALGNKYRGKGMDLDQYAADLSGRLNGAPAAVVSQEKPSGK